MVRCPILPGLKGHWQADEVVQGCYTGAVSSCVRRIVEHSGLVGPWISQVTRKCLRRNWVLIYADMHLHGPRCPPETQAKWGGYALAFEKGAA